VPAKASDLQVHLAHDRRIWQQESCRASLRRVEAARESSLPVNLKLLWLP